MDKVNGVATGLLIEAVVLWTGWARETMPVRDDSILVKHFGAEIAAKLLPIMKSLEDDFYSSDARFVATDLQEMAELSSAQFRAKHPEIAEEVVKAFAWCYTFDYK